MNYIIKTNSLIIFKNNINKLLYAFLFFSILLTQSYSNSSSNDVFDFESLEFFLDTNSNYIIEDEFIIIFERKGFIYHSLNNQDINNNLDMMSSNNQVVETFNQLNRFDDNFDKNYNNLNFENLEFDNILLNQNNIDIQTYTFLNNFDETINLVSQTVNELSNSRVRTNIIQSSAYDSPEDSNIEFFTTNSHSSEVFFEILSHHKHLFQGISVKSDLNTLKEVHNVFPHFKIIPNILLEPMISNPQRELMDLEEIYNIQVEGQNLTGRGIRVAVLDTGIDYTHPDFGSCVLVETCPRILDAFDFSTGTNDVMDVSGHGTHVASILGSNNSNPELRGVAPEVDLYIYKVFSNAGGGDLSWFYQAVERSLDPFNEMNYDNRAHIISMSLGIPLLNNPNHLMSLYIDDISLISIPIVAAGNNGSVGFESIAVPGASRGAITVGASTLSDQITSFSSLGPTSIGTIKPDIVAPGQSICAANSSSLSPLFSQTSCQGSNQHVLKSGTSMATPAVSGIVALMLQQNNSLTTSQVKAILRQSAIDLNTSPLRQGWGRIDSLEAINLRGNSCIVEINTSYLENIENRVSFPVDSYINCNNFSHFEFHIKTLDGSYEIENSTFISNGTSQGFNTNYIDLSNALNRDSILKLKVFTFNGTNNSVLTNYDMLFVHPQLQDNQISYCTTITSSGSYNLANDIVIEDGFSQDCIKIETNNVALNCNNNNFLFFDNFLENNNSLISAQSIENIVISNCNFDFNSQYRNSSFSLYIENSTNIELQNISLNNSNIKIFSSQNISLNQIQNSRTNVTDEIDNIDVEKLPIIYLYNISFLDEFDINNLNIVMNNSLVESLAFENNSIFSISNSLIDNLEYTIFNPDFCNIISIENTSNFRGEFYIFTNNISTIENISQLSIHSLKICNSNNNSVSNVSFDNIGEFSILYSNNISILNSSFSNLSLEISFLSNNMFRNIKLYNSTITLSNISNSLFDNLNISNYQLFSSLYVKNSTNIQFENIISNNSNIEIELSNNISFNEINVNDDSTYVNISNSNNTQIRNSAISLFYEYNNLDLLNERFSLILENSSILNELNISNINIVMNNSLVENLIFQNNSIFSIHNSVIDNLKYAIPNSHFCDLVNLENTSNFRGKLYIFTNNISTLENISDFSIYSIKVCNSNNYSLSNVSFENIEEILILYSNNVSIIDSSFLNSSLYLESLFNNNYSNIDFYNSTISFVNVTSSNFKYFIFENSSNFFDNNSHNNFLNFSIINSSFFHTTNYSINFNEFNFFKNFDIKDSQFGINLDIGNNNTYLGFNFLNVSNQLFISSNNSRDNIIFNNSFDLDYINISLIESNLIYTNFNNSVETILGNISIGNYWSDFVCQDVLVVDDFGICNNPQNYTISSLYEIFDFAPLVHLDISSYPVPEIIEFNVSNSSLSLVTNITLSWDSINSHRCEAGGDWNDSIGVNGTLEIKVNDSRVFELTCFNIQNISTFSNISISFNISLNDDNDSGDSNGSGENDSLGNGSTPPPSSGGSTSSPPPSTPPRSDVHGQSETTTEIPIITTVPQNTTSSQSNDEDENEHTTTIQSNISNDEDLFNQSNDDDTIKLTLDEIKSKLSNTTLLMFENSSFALPEIILEESRIKLSLNRNNASSNDFVNIYIDENISPEELDLLNLHSILVDEGNYEDLNFMIISGLGRSNYKNKEIFLKRSSQEIRHVCVIDSFVDSVEDFSGMCNRFNELLLTCDGSLINNRYRCFIQGDNFRVLGLRHSAVIEIHSDSIQNFQNQNDENDSNQNVPQNLLTQILIGLIIGVSFIFAFMMVYSNKKGVILDENSLNNRKLIRNYINECKDFNTKETIRNQLLVSGFSKKDVDREIKDIYK